jgi:RNA polymerase-binding transcription factor DksA
MTIAQAQKGSKQKASLDHVRFRTLLTSQEKELYARVQRGLGRMIAGRECDDAGVIATENYADNPTALNIERDRSILGEIIDALVRLEAGSYGLCETCNIVISSARFEALPWTRKCVKCAEGRMAA